METIYDQAPNSRDIPGPLSQPVNLGENIVIYLYSASFTQNVER